VGVDPVHVPIGVKSSWDRGSSCRDARGHVPHCSESFE
jgi:hypothetical protein